MSTTAQNTLNAYFDDVFIDGEWRTADGAGRIELIDPATEAAWGSVPDASEADVDAAVRAASAAFARPGWSRLAAGERAVVLRRFADELEAEHGPLPVDELERRARSMLSAHMKRLALRSSQARRGQLG